MAQVIHTHKVNNLDKIEIKIKLAAQLRFRVWLATLLIRIAGILLSAKMEIERA